MNRFTSALTLVLVFAWTTASAAVPPVLHFSGQLGTEAGSFTGSVAATLTLYDDPTESEPENVLWSETIDAEVVAGRFEILLGADAANPLPESVLVGPELYIGVQVGDDDEMTPRMRIASVPFAFRAADAELFAGMTPDEFAPAMHQHDFSEITGAVDGLQLPEGIVYAADLAAGLEGKAEAAHQHPITDLGGAGCELGELLAWDGETWVCVAPPSDGLAFGVGDGLQLIGTELSVDDEAIGAWATAACFDTPEELRDALDAVYVIVPEACADGQVPAWSDADATWVCREAAPTLSEAEIDALVANNGYAAAGDLAAIATSGSFADLLDVPADLLDGDSDTFGELTCPAGTVPQATDTGWTCALISQQGTVDEDLVDGYVSDNGYALVADLAPVAITGSFGDLADVPAEFLDGDADALSGLTCGEGDVATFDGDAWTCLPAPKLEGGNAFLGDQSIEGNLTVSGVVTAGTPLVAYRRSMTSYAIFGSTSYIWVDAPERVLTYTKQIEGSLLKISAGDTFGYHTTTVRGDTPACGWRIAVEAGEPTTTTDDIALGLEKWINGTATGVSEWDERPGDFTWLVPDLPAGEYVIKLQMTRVYGTGSNAIDKCRIGFTRNQTPTDNYFMIEEIPTSVRP